MLHIVGGVILATKNCTRKTLTAIALWNPDQQIKNIKRKSKFKFLSYYSMNFFVIFKNLFLKLELNYDISLIYQATHLKIC